MTRIAPIRLAHSTTTLWFDALDLELFKDQAVVVLTARGVEFGHVVDELFEATEEQLKQLKSPLKPVKRLATDEDIVQAQQMEELAKEALPVFRELAAETNEEMHPVSVEYLFEGDKAVFYFEAEDRVDFRELVRKLAAHFHVRVDMRQIGVRDEARLVGGLGHCGQELCCKRLGGEFNPVSIRMAKEQDLSLNPQKISGLCGRLMCCLRYEYDAYKEFKSRAPKPNATIQTPDGPAKVSNLDVPREIITLKTKDDKVVKVPLGDMDEPAAGATRPCSICAEAWERALEAASVGSLSKTTFLTSQFTQNDKIGEATAVRHEASGKAMPSKNQATKKQKTKQSAAPVQETPAKPYKRRRSTKVGVAGVEQVSSSAEGKATRTGDPRNQGLQVVQEPKPAKRKRRRFSPADGAARNEVASPKASRETAHEGLTIDKQSKQGPRPGQKSSGLRQSQAAARKKRDNAAAAQNSAGSAKLGNTSRRGGKIPQKKTDATQPAPQAQTASPNTSAPKQDTQRKARRRFRKPQNSDANGE